MEWSSKYTLGYESTPLLWLDDWMSGWKSFVIDSPALESSYGEHITYSRDVFTTYENIGLEPVCPLFWGLNPPDEGLFQAKQGSFGFHGGYNPFTNLLLAYILGEFHPTWICDSTRCEWKKWPKHLLPNGGEKCWFTMLQSKTITIKKNPSI